MIGQVDLFHVRLAVSAGVQAVERHPSPLPQLRGVRIRTYYSCSRTRRPYPTRSYRPLGRGTSKPRPPHMAHVASLTAKASTARFLHVMATPGTPSPSTPRASAGGIAGRGAIMNIS